MLKVWDDIKLLEDIEDREGIRIYAEKGECGYITRIEKTTYLVSVPSGAGGRITLRVNQNSVVGR